MLRRTDRRDNQAVYARLVGLHTVRSRRSFTSRLTSFSQPLPPIARRNRRSFGARDLTGGICAIRSAVQRRARFGVARAAIGDVRLGVDLPRRPFLRISAQSAKGAPCRHRRDTHRRAGRTSVVSEHAVAQSPHDRRGADVRLATVIRVAVAIGGTAAQDSAHLPACSRCHAVGRGQNSFARMQLEPIRAAQ